MKRVAVLGSSRQFEAYVSRLVSILGNAKLHDDRRIASFQDGSYYHSINSLAAASQFYWDDYALLSGIASPSILKEVQANLKKKGKEAR